MTHLSKRIGTHRMVSHSSELILARNDSSLDCLYLALAYKYFFVEETWFHDSIYWQQGKYQLRANWWILVSDVDPWVTSQLRHPLVYYRICIYLIYFDKYLYIKSRWLIRISFWKRHSGKLSYAWWRHQMETFSALLALCAGNSPVPVNSQHKGQWRGALMFSLI